MVTIRTILAIIVSKHWHNHQMDVFLARGSQGWDIHGPFIGLYQTRGNKQKCVVKSLYGLKQALKQWNAKLIEVLLQPKQIQSQYDHSLFVKKIEKGTVIFVVYVDDMLVIGDSLSLIEEAKLSLQQIFKMKDLGEFKYFLGIEFARLEKWIIMHQRK